MGTNCAPLVADLFLFCYERGFMMSFSVENQFEIIEAFSSTSRYLDDLLNIDNTYFDGLISQIYATPPPPPPSKLNKANSSVTECVCRLHIFVLVSHLASLWESNCPFGFPLVMFPLGSSYFVFVFLSLWCVWWRCGIIVSVPDHYSCLCSL